MKTKIELLEEAMYEAGRDNPNDTVMEALHDTACDQLDESMGTLGIEWDDLSEDQKEAAVLRFKEGFWSSCNTEQLLRRVLHTAYDEAESWRDDGIGMALAYLVKAVLDEGCVEWPEDSPACLAFRRMFPEGDDVWKHITVTPR